MFTKEQNAKNDHIKACKEMMQEAAGRENLIIKLNEYQEYNETLKKFNVFIEILLRDKDGYLIYKAYDVSNILGFLDGLRHCKKAI